MRLAVSDSGPKRLRREEFCTQRGSRAWPVLGAKPAGALDKAPTDPAKPPAQVSGRRRPTRSTTLGKIVDPLQVTLGLCASVGLPVGASELSGCGCEGIDTRRQVIDHKRHQRVVAIDIGGTRVQVCLVHIAERGLSRNFDGVSPVQRLKARTSAAGSVKPARYATWVRRMSGSCR